MMKVIHDKHFTLMPAPHSYISDVPLRSMIAEKGWCILNSLNAAELTGLNELYQEKHDLVETGMFYSLYSKDLAYRKEIYDRINGILDAFFKKYFESFRSWYNIFVLKAPGRESEFFVHQEPSMMDESQFSPLHVWIPLEDIDERNGAVCVVERSHRLYSPQRGISFDPIFGDILPLVHRYMTPLYMKAGEVLIFDPRLIHFSLPNFSDHTRAAVLCGLAPQEAEVIIAHRETGPGQKIELIAQHPDFFLTAEDFYLNCKCRPETGQFVAHSDYEPYSLTADEFEDFCRCNDITPKDILPPSEQIDCIMYGEPRQEMNLYNSRTFTGTM